MSTIPKWHESHPLSQLDQMSTETHSLCSSKNGKNNSKVVKVPKRVFMFAQMEKKNQT